MSACATSCASDYVRLAIDIARQHFGGFGVAGELGSGFQREFAADAIADVGQVAERRAEIIVGQGVVQFLLVARAAGGEKVFHMGAGGVAAGNAAFGMLFHDEFTALALDRKSVV